MSFNCFNQMSCNGILNNTRVFERLNHIFTRTLCDTLAMLLNCGMSIDLLQQMFSHGILENLGVAGAADSSDAAGPKPDDAKV